MDKDCSSALPFQKVRWRYSVARGSKRAKPTIRWQEMAGPGRHFRGASGCSVTLELGLRGAAAMRLVRQEGSLWPGVWWAVLSRVNSLLFYMPSLFLIFTPIVNIIPPLDYDLLHTSLSYYGMKPSTEISHLILYDQLLSSSWYIVIVKSRLLND